MPFISELNTMDQNHRAASPAGVPPLVAPYLALFESRVESFYEDLFRDFSSNRETRLRIDEEFEAIQQAARIVMSRRNTLLPIFSLPPETLGVVISWLSTIDPFSREQFVTKLGWLKITHVCQRLRGIALDQATLWSQLYDTNVRTPSWFLAFLSRSKDAPLSLRVSHGLNISSEHLRMVLSSGRVEELDLGRSARAHTELLSNFIASFPPNLHLLHVKNPSRTTLAMPLRSSVVGQPLMESLQLFRVNFKWETLQLFTRLQRLVLKFPDPRSNTPPSDRFGTWNAFIECMASLPHLKFLSLHNCLPGSDHDSDSSLRIHMAGLKKLDITDRIATTLACLAVLAIPKTTHVHLSCHFNTVSPEDDRREVIDRFFAFLAPHLSKIKRLFISETLRHYRVKAFAQARCLAADALHPLHAMHTDTPTFSLYLRHHGPRPTTSLFLHSPTLVALRSVTQVTQEEWEAQEVEELCIESNSPDWTYPAWTFMSDKFPLVDQLQVGRNAGRALCEALCINSSDPVESEDGFLHPPRFLFTRMYELVITQCDLERDMELPIVGASDGSSKPIHLLQECFVRRPPSMSPTFIYFRECRTSADRMSDLQATLPQDVQWDSIGMEMVQDYDFDFFDFAEHNPGDDRTDDVYHGFTSDEDAEGSYA